MYNNNVIVIVKDGSTCGAVGYPRDMSEEECVQDLQLLFSRWVELPSLSRSGSDFVNWLGNNTRYFQVDPPYVLQLN
jgi:hypothetical protein